MNSSARQRARSAGVLASVAQRSTDLSVTLLRDYGLLLAGFEEALHALLAGALATEAQRQSLERSLAGLRERSTVLPEFNARVQNTVNELAAARRESGL